MGGFSGKRRTLRRKAKVSEEERMHQEHRKSLLGLGIDIGIARLVSGEIASQPVEIHFDKTTAYRLFEPGPEIDVKLHLCIERERLVASKRRKKRHD